jgi:hypothetical protein
MHADRRPGRVPALGQELRVAEYVHLPALECGQGVGELSLRGLAGDRLGVDSEFLEGGGDVLRVLDPGRVDDAGRLAEA